MVELEFCLDKCVTNPMSKRLGQKLDCSICKALPNKNGDNFLLIKRDDELPENCYFRLEQLLIQEKKNG